jgi:c-di-GMP phosphodiesterase Gmr
VISFEQSGDIITIINSIAGDLKAPFFIEGFEIFSSASIGVSIFPEHGCDYETLRRHADSAMYQIKRGPKGAGIIFDPQADLSEMARVRTEQRLRWAIQDRRFRCAFQPKVEIQTEVVIGVEALIRLIDEDGELCGPSSFVDLAFELGLGDDLTYLVASEIVKSIDLINAAFGTRVSISINVSAKQIASVDFMRSLVEMLKGTNCPDRFIVEVTEDAFVSASPLQTQVLPMLREAGVRISIDDFGTGYSALSMLANFTADEIKIDRSFITDIHKQPRNQSIIKAIESLSNALGITVVAEGIESFEELAYLRAATRIRYAQGYYFARPLFLEDFSSAKHFEVHSPKTSLSRAVRNRDWCGRFNF